jgi:hypothetical protein
VAAALVLQGGIALARHGFLSRPDFLEHSTAARLVLEYVPAAYNPTHEIFMERTLHREGWPDGPVVFEAQGRCRKALVRGRQQGALVKRCGPLPAGAVGSPTGAEEKRAWVYVDF